MKKIYLIHENKEWLKPLEEVLLKKGVSYIDWYMVDKIINLSTIPPEGVFYNKMSASSHFRGHRYSPEITTGLISWLEANKRLVINGSNAMRLELSKIIQYSELSLVGLRVPRTICAINSKGILEAVDILKFPIILKHNRAGMGIGVRLFHSDIGLKEYVFGDNFEKSVDGITLIQEYIYAPDDTIIRVEFVDKKILYAVRVNTESGFELCPADECLIIDNDLNNKENRDSNAKSKFVIIENFLSIPFAKTAIKKMKKLMSKVGIDIASFELIIDKNGDFFVYDINVNTNYNSNAEKKTRFSGVVSVAEYLERISKN